MKKIIDLENTHPIIFIDYAPRLVGHMIVMFFIYTYYYVYSDIMPFGAVVLATFNALIWPQAALFSSLKSKNPKILEYRFLILDCALIGVMCALMHYELWIVVVMVFSVTTAVLCIGGPGLLLKGIAVLMVSAVLTSSIFGFDFMITSSNKLIGMAILGIVTFSSLLGYLTYIRSKVLIKAKKKLKNTYLEISYINELVQATGSTLNINEIMKVAIRAFNEIINTDMVIIYLVDNDKGEIKIHSHYGIEKNHDTLNKFTAPLNEDSCIAAKVYIDDKMIYTSNISEKNILSYDKLIYKVKNYATVIALPLEVKNKPIGVLSIYSFEKQMEVTDIQIKKIQQFIAQVSIIINNAIVFNDNEESKKVLNEKNQELQKISNKISRYLTPQVYDAIFHGGELVETQSERKRLTIFFCDIPGFTKLANSFESEIITTILNQYLDEMSKIVNQYGGTIDKYIGDSIMIFFGAPETKGPKEDAINCVMMALSMKEKMAQLSRDWSKYGLFETTKIRAGINTGYATVGNFGSDYRVDYTLVGGQVNLCSRLQYNANPDDILISEETYLLVKNKILCEKMEMITVKGIVRPVQTYRVISVVDKEGVKSESLNFIKHGFQLSLDSGLISATDKLSAIEMLESVKKDLSKQKSKSHFAHNIYNKYKEVMTFNKKENGKVNKK